jgi:hypothetical protein
MNWDEYTRWVLGITLALSQPPHFGIDYEEQRLKLSSAPSLEKNINFVGHQLPNGIIIKTP